MDIYLPSYGDNRNRIYYGTLISHTFYKIFRYLYEFSDDKELKHLKQSKYYNKIIKYKTLVKEFNLNEEKSYFLIVLLMEVGKFFIEENDNCITKTEIFIKVGLYNYKIKNKNINFSFRFFQLNAKNLNSFSFSLLNFNHSLLFSI